MNFLQLILCFLAALLITFVDKKGISQLSFVKSRGSRKEGEGLLSVLQQIQLSPQLPQLQQQVDLPEYKFYTKLLIKILNQARLKGSSYKEILWEWRSGIQKDLQYDKKQQEIIRSTVFQICALVAITWFFHFFTSFSLGLKIDSFFLYLVLALHILGCTSTALVIPFIYQRLNKGIPELFESLYTLKSLSALSLPTTEVIKLANLDQLSSGSGELKKLTERFFEVIKNYQIKGAPIHRENQLLLDELHFYRENKSHSICQKLEQLKVLIIIIFFIPAYFVFVVGLVKCVSFSF